MGETSDAAPKPPPYCACPNQPYNYTQTAKGIPTHAPCPSQWLCSQRGCQYKPVTSISGDDKSLFQQVFGGKW
jgi:hypothetical protein